jgi:hypothetical protein
MNMRTWVAGLLAPLSLLVGAAQSRAGDVIRLGLPGQGQAKQSSTVLLGQGPVDAETLTVGRGGFHGGFHGSVGVHRGYVGGYRGFVGGYRGYGYYGGYRGGIVGYAYPRLYTPYYYPRTYYYGGYYPGVIGSYPYYSGCSYPITTVVPSASFSLSIGTPRAQLSVLPTPVPSVAQPSQPVAPAQPGTFDYDGGPSQPVPMPSAEPAPMSGPPTVPLEGRPVSLPVQNAPRYRYPAYGEKPEPARDQNLRRVSR